MLLTVGAAALALVWFSAAWTTEARQTSTDAAAGWTKLFNGKDLSGWDTYLGPRMDAKQEKIPGTVIGLNKDPDKVFTVTTVDGGPVIASLA